MKSTGSRLIKTWSTPVGKESTRTIPCALCGGAEFSPHLSCSENSVASSEGFSYVRCRHCGLVQMNPQPEQAEVTRRYREGSGTEYLSYEIKNESAFLHLQELALEDAGLEELEMDLHTRSAAKLRALDIGCATGALLEKLRDRSWAVTGVEISPAAEYARKNRSLDVRSLPLEENRFPDAGFDMVLASHLIEHLNDPSSFIREVYRILTPGGYFIVTTPNISGFQARLFRSRWRSAIFDHLYLFSIKTLSRLLTKHGFTIERVRTWGGLAAGIAPAPLKRIADRAAKFFTAGDVMLIRARTARCE
ncbi:class I SAM-dependent methyltransferase [Treponema primitia]|uniref:class I SAM-dependent methyltransferase n=1 Tax=Treponema primitia TaxID=88058 RepID=UPI003980B830